MLADATFASFLKTEYSKMTILFFSLFLFIGSCPNMFLSG